MADKKRHIYIDLETSGLDPTQHCILGIGAVIELSTKDPNKLAEFEILVRPTEQQWAAASPEALKVNGLTWEKLQADGVPLTDATDAFCDWLVANKSGACEYVGQNPAFDVKFMLHYMGDALRFIGFDCTHPFDNRELYSRLINLGKVPFIKRRTGKEISLALQVEPEPDVHLALAGAQVVRRNYLKMVELGVRD